MNLAAIATASAAVRTPDAGAAAPAPGFGALIPPEPGEAAPPVADPALAGLITLPAAAGGATLTEVSPRSVPVREALPAARTPPPVAPADPFAALPTPAVLIAVDASGSEPVAPASTAPDEALPSTASEGEAPAEVDVAVAAPAIAPPVLPPAGPAAVLAAPAASPPPDLAVPSEPAPAESASARGAEVLADQKGRAAPGELAAASPAATGAAEAFSRAVSPEGALPPAPAQAPQRALAAPADQPDRASLAPPPHEPIVAAQAGQLGRNIGVEIARQVAAGREEVLIRLDPAELGRIDVRLSFDTEGSLRAVMAAESASALEMLRRDAGELGRALTEAGVRADAQSFRFDTRGGDDGRAWQRGHHRASDGASSGDEQPLATASSDPVYRPLRSSGRVDLMA